MAATHETSHLEVIVMNDRFTIGTRHVGAGHPTYIIAEMSANHRQDFEHALGIMRAASDAGVDAIKIQTYRPDTITLDADNEHFRIRGGGIGEGRTLFDLYGEAYTPWEWQATLQRAAQDLGLDFFSTPFDFTAVDFLEDLKVPVYKIASFELVDVPLLKRVAATGKPVIMSTGMASLDEISEAVAVLATHGTGGIALLKCTSAYPARPESMNLRTIPDMAARFQVPVGLSDHTLGLEVPIAAVALGACIIEKHLTMSRGDPGPDSKFSLEPAEFTELVRAVRTTERALGVVSYTPTSDEHATRAFRRSLFVARDVRAGERLSADAVRSVRPAGGLHPRHLDEVVGRVASRDLAKGTPLTWDMLA
jgi:pseudaminic acid synthase